MAALIAARLLLILGVLAIVGTVNALARPNHDRSWHLRPWWFFAMLTAELVPVRFVIRLAVVAALAALGALDHGAGRVGLGLIVTAWAGHLWILARASRARGAMAKAMTAAGVDGARGRRTGSLRALAGNPYRVPKGIERVENLTYGPGLELDLYRNPGNAVRPAILQVHGGSWRGGNRRQQARPLLHELAARGWITAAASYPLVPDADVAGQVAALKRALVWMRTDGRAFGIDPGFIAITGGSAGGHLASLVALTAGDERFEAGLEGADTSVQAAVPLYGIYDLLNRNNTRDHWPIVKALMRAGKREAEERYRAASPLDRIGPHAPPFLIVHGSHDSVVSTAEADQFARALEASTESPVAYAVIPGANHAFDVVYSWRTLAVVNGIERFLNGVRD